MGYAWVTEDDLKAVLLEIVLSCNMHSPRKNQNKGSHVKHFLLNVTHYAPIMTAANDIFCYLSWFLLGSEIKLEISCESSAGADESHEISISSLKKNDKI